MDALLIVMVMPMMKKQRKQKQKMMICDDMDDYPCEDNDYISWSDDRY